jgi:hypothetical protein
MVVNPAGCPPITLSPPTLPSGTVGDPYSQTITASGGTAPYTFAVVVGSLPAGLTLTPGGVLAGTPTAPTTSTVTIQGTDANGCLASVTYTLGILRPVPTLPQWGAWLLVLGLLVPAFLWLRRQSSVA